jgi:hypothetical protein
MMKTALVLLFGIGITGQAVAQNAPSPQHLPRGTATDVSNAEILATRAEDHHGAGERSADPCGELPGGAGRSPQSAARRLRRQVI